MQECVHLATLWHSKRLLTDSVRADSVAKTHLSISLTLSKWISEPLIKNIKEIILCLCLYFVWGKKEKDAFI